VDSRHLTITAPYEPLASLPRARTHAGTLTTAARRWRAGLAWSARLALLQAWPAPAPPYDVTVRGYFPPDDFADQPRLRDWFDGIAAALGAALDVEPAQLHLKLGRTGYAPPFSPAHFEITVTEVAPPSENGVICPACGESWALDPAPTAADRCPHCGQEGAGIPFLLGIL